MWIFHARFFYTRKPLKPFNNISCLTEARSKLNCVRSVELSLWQNTFPTPAGPARELNEIRALEESLALPHFTADDAWKLGTLLRDMLLDASSPVVINITLANSNQVLFHTVTRSGTAPDNDLWVARKRATVLRWGCSSWFMHVKMEGNEQKFKDKFMLGEHAGAYAIHGGGVPILVQSVEGVVAVAVVSGLKQEEDHMAVIEALRKLKKDMSS